MKRANRERKGNDKTRGGTKKTIVSGRRERKEREGGEAKESAELEAKLSQFIRVAALSTYS